MNREQMMYVREMCVRMRSLEDAVQGLTRHLQDLSRVWLDPSLPIPKKYVTIDEAATYLNMSPHTVRNLCSRRIIPHSKVGGRMIRIEVKRLDKMMDMWTVKSLFEDRFGR